MKKTMVPFYKPNKKGTGSALQLTRSQSGINLQLAKQATLDSAEGKATFDWDKNSFSVALSMGEISKILVASNKAKEEVNRIKLLNKTISDPTKKLTLDPSELIPVKLPHVNSKVPKTVNLAFQEFPTGSLNLTMKLDCYGSMSYFENKEFKIKENQNASIFLSEEETLSFMEVIENESKNQLEDNSVTSKVVNLSEKDPKGYKGYKTINEVPLPNLSVGDSITSVRKDLVFVIEQKAYDVEEGKVIYFCKGIKINV